MPTRQVLIVDRIAAFAQILRENLERVGSYVVSVASTGEAAIDLLSGNVFHLAILDVALPDVTPEALLDALREIDPHLHIVFIPPFGEELDQNLAALDIQGILHKPFIVSRLDAQVQSFLEQKVLTAPPSRADVLRGRAEEIRPLLDTFSQDVSARLAALICQAELILHVARAPYEQADRLVPLIEDSLEVSARLSAFLGDEQGRFGLTSYVGENLSLYAQAFDEDLVLVAVPGEGIPPGVVHLGLKRVVEGVSELLHRDS